MLGQAAQASSNLVNQTSVLLMKETMSNRSLAFLCACETAMGDEKLPEEVMSLSASLIFSGFRRVVGSMWCGRVFLPITSW